MTVFTPLAGLLGVVAGAGFTYIYFKKKEKKQSMKAVEQIQNDPSESWIEALSEEKNKKEIPQPEIKELPELPIKKLPEGQIIEERPKEEIKEDLNTETTSNKDKVNNLINKFQTELNTLKSEGSDLPNKEGDTIKEELKKTPAPSLKNKSKKK